MKFAQFVLRIYHVIFAILSNSGLDGGKFDWIKVRTSDDRVFQCNFYQFLDNNDLEKGSECKLN